MTKKILVSELSPFGARLRIASALKGLQLTFEPAPGGSGSAELKKLTPFGRVPALVTNKGNVLVESLALLEYLEDTHPGARSLRPHDAEQLARARMIGLLFDHNVIKALGPVFAQLTAAKPDVAVVHKSFDDVAAEIEKLVFFFDQKGPGAVGEISIADCAIAPFAWLMDVLSAGFGATSPTQRVPAFAAWWSRIGQLPEVKQVTDGMQKAMAAFMAAKKAQAQ
jgi:glutathione S-transferase